MKKIYILIFLIISAYLCTNLQLRAAKGSFSTTNNKAMDFSAFNYESINEKYGYGTIRWTNLTKVIPISPDGESTYFTYDSSKGCYRIGATWQEALIKFRITNCAVDKFGNVCDVIVTVDNMKQTSRDISESPFVNFAWHDYGNEYFGLPAKKRTDTDLVRNVIDIFKSTTIDSVKSNIISFGFETISTSSDFTLQYVLAGTSTPINKYTNLKNGQMGIPGIQASMYDIDYSTDAAAFANSGDWNCCEAFYVYNDTSIFFDSKTTSKARNIAINVDGHPGVRTPFGKKVGSEDWSDVYATATIISDLNNDSIYKMRYSGFGCGLYYCFINEITADVTSPMIEVDKKIVNEEEVFNYKITQSVPSNYYSYLIRSKIGLQDSPVIEKVLIENDLSKLFDDSIDCLSILNMPTASQIKIINALNNKDVTNDFTIEIDKTIIKARAKNINNPEFYGQSYVVNIPISFKKDAGKYISNEGVTVDSIKNSCETDYGIKKLYSNEVETSLCYSCMLDVEIDHGKVIKKLVNKENNKNNVLINNSCLYESEFSISDDYIFVSANYDGSDVTDEIIWDGKNGRFTNTSQVVRENEKHKLIIVTEPKMGSVITHYQDIKGNDLIKNIVNIGQVKTTHISKMIKIPKYALYDKPFSSIENIDVNNDNDVKVKIEEGVIHIYYIYHKNNGIVTYSLKSKGNYNTGDLDE